MFILSEDNIDITSEKDIKIKGKNVTIDATKFTHPDQENT